MKCNINRAATPAQLDADKLLTIGMAFVLLTLSEHFGWGKKRLKRLYDKTFEMVREEFRPKSQRFTTEYRDDLEYQLDRIQRLLETRLR